jgi:hypothetical protein
MIHVQCSDSFIHEGRMEEEEEYMVYIFDNNTPIQLLYPYSVLTYAVVCKKWAKNSNM